MAKINSVGASLFCALLVSCGGGGGGGGDDPGRTTTTNASAPTATPTPGTLASELQVRLGNSGAPPLETTLPPPPAQE